MDDAIAGAYIDTMPDSDVTGPMRGSVQHPGVTWGNAFTGDAAPSATEMVYENTGVALAAAPANLAYTSSKGVRSVVAFAPAVTVNTRVRIQPTNEGRAFATPSPAAAMLQRDELSDYGAVAIPSPSFNISYATMGGPRWMIYGYAVKATLPMETATIIGRVEQKIPKPLLFAAGETVVGQIGNLALGSAGSHIRPGGLVAARRQLDGFRNFSLRFRDIAADIASRNININITS